MKPRAQVIVPVLASLLSAASIVAVAAAGATPTNTEIKTLKKFQTTFNEKLTSAIQQYGGAAPDSSFITYRCTRDFAAEIMQKVPKPPTPPSTPEASAATKTTARTNLCELSNVEEQTKLRAAVNDWLEQVYKGQVPRNEWEPIVKAGKKGYRDIFSEKLQKLQ